MAGRPIVISVDPEFNHYIVKQEGKLVELWYMDSFSSLFSMEGESRTTALGVIHKYVRSIILDHFGTEPLKEKLLGEHYPDNTSGVDITRKPQNHIPHRCQGAKILNKVRVC